MKNAILSCLMLLLISSSANAQSSAIALETEHIVNGDFELGDLSGWLAESSGAGIWQINDGTFDPPGRSPATEPIFGNFDAISSQTGPSLNILAQDVTLPTSLTSASLSWSDRIRNNAGGGFSDPNQEWRVLIEDVSGALIHDVFSTNPGDPNQPDPNFRNFDLTSVLKPFEGSAIRISFEQEDNLGNFNASLDGVSFTTTSTAVPEPSNGTLILLGLLALCGRKRRS